ncbi:glutamic acid-rich protein-like [Papaver somniferum]|uniref:glutamic acid-rich protein-like n=1 Tax=Papaver somniferum TaxID=3469 RepID=UPI000E6FF433|nr:glutamic acid-rich protein-like [Papaver somniferum]
MDGYDNERRRKGKAPMTEEKLLKELEEKERLQPLWEEMHAAMDEIKAEEKPFEKPVEKPLQILQKKRHFDIFIDEEEEEKFWEVQSKKMRLAEMATNSEANDADEDEEEEWFDEDQEESGEEEEGSDEEEGGYDDSDSE